MLISRLSKKMLMVHKYKLKINKYITNMAENSSDMKSEYYSEHNVSVIALARALTPIA